MTYPHGGATMIWRDGIDGAHNPDKLAIRDWGQAVQVKIDTVQEGQRYGVLLASVWSDLLTLTGAQDGSGAEVPDTDTGTHQQATATGYDGAVVPNAGQYGWSLAWSRWVWIGETGLSGKADIADVQQPVWTGSRTAWLDPFWLHVQPGVNFFDKARWNGAAATEWAIAAGSIFGGNVLSRTAPAGAGALTGPIAQLDDIGAVPGDQVTVCALVAGDGGTMQFPIRPMDAGYVPIGSQERLTLADGATFSVVLEATPQLVYKTITLPADATMIRMYPYITTGDATLEIHALWAFKGASDAGPLWPVYDADTYLVHQAIHEAETATPAAVVSWAPPEVYGVDGVETALYQRALVADDGERYNWNITTNTHVIQQNERFRLLASAASGPTVLTVNGYLPNSEVAAFARSTSLTTVAASAGTGATETVLFLGDSLIAAGGVTQTVLDLEAADVMGVTLIGTRGTGANLHEGRGGYKVDDFATAGRTYYEFTVSGVTTPPAINAATYSDGTSTVKVQEVRLTGGAGVLECELISGPAPSGSGTLTKTNAADGDASITFSAVAASAGNPFWIGGVLDFPQYLTDNGFAVPDWTFISLGINDIFNLTSDGAVAALAVTEFDKLDDLIASIKSAGATNRVALCPACDPARDQDAFGADYGSGQTRWRQKRNVAIWNQALVARYGASTGDRIYISPMWQAVDTANNMRRGAWQPINDKVATITTVASYATQVGNLAPADGAIYYCSDAAVYLVKVGASGFGGYRAVDESDGFVRRANNGVHPSNAGYQQAGVAAWSMLKALA